MANEQQGQVGKVVQVMGAVVDIAFSDDQELPAIYNAIHVKDEEGTVPVDVICETMQHLGDGVVRTVAMSSTDGMVRGMKAVDTGRAIAVSYTHLSRTGRSTGKGKTGLCPCPWGYDDDVYRVACRFLQADQSRTCGSGAAHGRSGVPFS